MEPTVVNNSERLEWVDILKGLGILTVVWGHSGSQSAFYMFWFHMPLFFLISGFLYRFKPQQTWSAYVQKKIKHLLVPYLFYLLLLTLMMMGVSFWKAEPVWQPLVENWKALFWGGSLLEGVYATFWFTTCLFVVQIAYDYVNRKTTKWFYKLLIIGGAFLLAYGESRYLHGIFVPWNADVALYAIVFYAFGDFIKQSKVLDKSLRRNIIFGLALMVSLGFTYLFTKQFLDYGLDMKHRQYYFLGTNLIVPISFTFVFIFLSMQIAKWPLLNRALTYLGQAAMVIMYLHFSAVYIARQFISITPVRFFIAGIVLPLIFYYVIKKLPYGRILALGENKAGVLPTNPEIRNIKRYNL